MTERQAFKYFFGAETAAVLGQSIVAVEPGFDLRGYVDEVAGAVEGLELKDRVKVMAAALRKRLPENYEDAVTLLLASLGPELSDAEGMFTHGWYLMPVARFVEEYGLDHSALSLHALQEITRRHTAEYAIRPYLTRYPTQTLAQLRVWTRHESFHVRRLVSEGSRPRLPWATRIDAFIRDPTPVLDLLDRMKDDTVPYVQKSIANNLNDITKDHPELVLETLGGWLEGEPAPGRQWIARHGLRTLIKAGDQRALALLGSTGAEQIRLDKLTLGATALRIGEQLPFACTISNTDSQAHKLSIDYAIHFVRGRGQRNEKVFKLTTITLPSGESRRIERSHSFERARIRRYYPGQHRFELKINGRVVGGREFELQDE